MPSRTDKRPRLRMDPAERRELILSAASRAFASRPYEEVSLAEIAEEAQASEALVHKYFVGKAGIYAQVLQGAVDELAERSLGWMAYQILAGHEPGEAARVRQEAREAAVRALAEVVGGSRGHRDDFAFWGYLGFLDDACLRWVRAGCPDDQRHSLVDAALGCLEGALGDWRA